MAEDCLKEILSRSLHHKKKITKKMVQLIGNFDFAALCLPTVPWGKSTRKMQFFRKVIIEIDRCCFLNRSVSVFAAADLFFFSSSNYFFFFSRQLNFPPIERSNPLMTTAFRFQFWGNQKRQDMHSTK